MATQKNKDYKLSWNMLVWLREDAKREVAPLDYDNLDKEYAVNIYKYPHWYVARKALQRRGLIAETHEVTEAGWNVVKQHWPRLYAAYKKMKKEEKKMKTKKKIYRVDCYSKYGNRYEQHFLIDIDDESLIKQVEERIRYGLYDMEQRRTWTIWISTGTGFKTQVAKFERNKQEKWERKIHV